MEDGMSTSERQLQAERSHVLKDLLLELGGLAHEHMTTKELDHVLDNMLTKASPSNPSVDMQRWVHNHRNNADYKIYQILGAHVAKISSLVPECFGKFHDASAAECRACLDRTMCSAKTRSNKNSDGEPAGLVSIKLSYPIKTPTTDALSDLLSKKNGQIAKSLHHGNKVQLVVINNKLRVLTVDATNPTTKEMIMAKKGAVPAEVEELDEELDGEELESEEGEEEEVEDEAEEVEGEDEEEAEEAEEVEAAPVKAKKTPKPKPVLNKAQQEFQDALSALPDTAAKQKYSQATIKKLGIKHDNNSDDRVAHMQRVMAVKKHLATATKTVAAKPAPAAAAPAKKATKK